MNVFEVPIVPGISVPDEYVCISLSELSSRCGASVSEVRAHIESFNEEGSASLRIYRRLSDGVEMVSSYIFSDLWEAFHV